MPWPPAAPEIRLPEAAMLADSPALLASGLMSQEPALAPAAPEAVLATAAANVSLNEDQIVQRVLLDLQRQIDLMLDYRLREVLTSVLTRATDAMVLEVRNELASTLRDIVVRSVAQELSRHRGS
jgi:hypothetical protein